MKYGGFFRVPLIVDEMGDSQYWSCIAWGELTRDSVEKCAGKRPYCDFAIRLKRGVFINCRCYKGNALYEIAKGLETGDYIAVFGVYSEHHYVTRRDTKYTPAGTEKIARSLDISFFVPAAILSDLFNNLYGVRDAPPDPMLSASQQNRKQKQKPKVSMDRDFDGISDFPEPEQDECKEEY